MKIIPKDNIPEELKKAFGDYICVGQLPNGQYCGYHRLMFHWTLLVNIDWAGYEYQYCYHDFHAGLRAMATWDGFGEPEGWNKRRGHPLLDDEYRK